MIAPPSPFDLRAGGGRMPILLSVPHAGRVYPAAVIAAARVAVETLEALEDRHVDRLIGPALAVADAAIVALLARAAIDLNRDERDLDLTMIDGAYPRATRPGARSRGGLGLLPRRLPPEGELWAQRVPAAEVERRIDGVHRPYHAEIARRLAALAGRHGTALLLDCHSMPPLGGRGAARMVFGTCGGASCDPAITAAAIAAARAAGLPCAIDRPYAGGHIVERHGRPAHGIHALQIEIDRSLYLAPDRRTIDPVGAERIGAVLGRIALAAGTAMQAPGWKAAAE